MAIFAFLGYNMASNSSLLGSYRIILEKAVEATELWRTPEKPDMRTMFVSHLSMNVISVPLVPLVL
jgi:hypothetical protein